MKEQDAAHSFDELIEQFNIKDMADRHALNEPHEMQAKVSFFTGANSLLPELTRLRSELQQKDEVISELKKDKEYLLDMVSKVMSSDSLTPSARATVWQQANECLSDNAVLRYK